MQKSVFLGMAALSWILLAVSFVRDRSRYRNCYMLFFSIVITILALSFFAGNHQMAVFSVLLTVMLFVLLTVPFFLICNGVLMIRREGHRLANLLSLGFGIIIGIGEAATYVAIMMPETVAPAWSAGGHLLSISRISMFLSVSVMYISMSFVVFMLYCIFLQIIPRKRDFDFVIIHGAGLLGGERVSKLLANRLDKAIEIFRRDPTPPVLIPSGGRGSDEKTSEAEAMERYLLGKGIPADKIVREDQSATTFENLKNSKAIIDTYAGGKCTVLVTSNYHVYRALRYCRKIGLKCTGVGAPVAFYYWPSALIREFIAVHAEKKHLFILIAGWILCMIPLVLAYFAF